MKLKKMNVRKAQIQSQIFIYIFAIIVISLIVIFGVKAIKSFQKDTEKVTLVNFQTDMNSIVARVAAEYGSVEKADILLSKDFRQVCFTDNNTVSASVSNPLINDSVGSKISDNVYIIKEKNDVTQFKTPTAISVNSPGHFMCVNNTKGKIIFTITGRSRFAEISP